MSDPKAIIKLLLKSEKIMYLEEYQFHKTRKWRFDFAMPEKKIAIEYEGGTWTGGSHVRGQRYASDCEKYNAAQLQGWVVFRYTADMIEKNPRQLIENLKRAL